MVTSRYNRSGPENLYKLLSGKSATNNTLKGFQLGAENGKTEKTKSYSSI